MMLNPQQIIKVRTGNAFAIARFKGHHGKFLVVEKHNPRTNTWADPICITEHEVLETEPRITKGRFRNV